MPVLINDRTTMIVAWAQALEDYGLNVNAKTQGWKNPCTIGDFVPDIHAFSGNHQLIGLVASEHDLKDFEGLVRKVLCLKDSKRNRETQINILIPEGRTTYVIKELRTFPDAEILIDHIWECCL